MKARKILALGVAAGLAALAVGCKSEQQTSTQISQEEYHWPEYERITSECISVSKTLPVAISNWKIDWREREYTRLYDSDFQEVNRPFLLNISLTSCKGNFPKLQYADPRDYKDPRSLREYGCSMVAETLYGDNVLAHRFEGNDEYNYRINDNPLSVERMQEFESLWKDICVALDCKGLLEKQERLKQEQ